jgi:ABC-2 type transport system ATP-binding protein
MTDAVIRTDGLAKSYGRVRALDGLTLEVPRGVVYGFLGPNGAGKTTTMRILTGLIRPDAGTIELFGRPYTRRDRTALREVGALIESPAFYPYLSGRDNLRVLAGAGAPPAPGRVDEVLEIVDLRDRAADRFETYSLGMKQRLGIAGALLNDPSLLMLDEPANGLDPAGIVAMRALLRGLASAGKTVFVSSHILPEIQEMAEQVAIINRGTVVRAGRLDELLGGSGQVRVRVIDGAIGRATEVLGNAFGAVSPSDNGRSNGWLVVRTSQDRVGELNRTLVTAGVDVVGLEVGSDLEELFLSLTEK